MFFSIGMSLDIVIDLIKYHRSARLKLLRLERENEQLDKTMEELKQASARVASLEMKNKELLQQSEEEKGLIATAQEVLIP